MNVVRNLSQKTHWRIKTHLAISHLDVNKISVSLSPPCDQLLFIVIICQLVSKFYFGFNFQNIVADMRKVLSKNPQVEQQRLHRRVFLDNIDPENQALLVSGFLHSSCSIYWSKCIVASSAA